MTKIMISLRKAKREEKKGKEEGLNYGRLTVKWNETCWYHEDYGQFVQSETRVIFVEWFSPMFIEPHETYT